MKSTGLELSIDPRILDSRVIMLCGISGSGKTTLARVLERKGFFRLSADLLIWELYGEDFLRFSSDEKKRIFGTIDAVIAERLAELLRQGRKIVVDSTMCKRFKRDGLREVCRRSGITPRLIFLDASLEVLNRRVASRSGDGPDSQAVTEDQLRTFFRNFERPAEDEECFVIPQR